MTASTQRKERLMNIISLPIYWTASKRHKSHTPIQHIKLSTHTLTHKHHGMPKCTLFDPVRELGTRQRRKKKNWSLPFKFNNANGRIPKVLKHVCRCIYSGIPVLPFYVSMDARRHMNHRPI